MTEDIDKILKGWERCNECRLHPFGTSKEYLDCEYTVGLYCNQNKLVWHTIDLLKELKEQCKEGHWIGKEDYNMDTYYDCSVCGESWTTIDGTPWQNGMNYCPNCGARMINESGKKDAGDNDIG